MSRKKISDLSNSLTADYRVLTAKLFISSFIFSSPSIPAYKVYSLLRKVPYSYTAPQVVYKCLACRAWKEAISAAIMDAVTHPNLTKVPKEAYSLLIGNSTCFSRFRIFHTFGKEYKACTGIVIWTPSFHPHSCHFGRTMLLSAAAFFGRVPLSPCPII